MADKHDGGHGDAQQPREMRLAFTHLALGPHYPPADISAEVGRVAIAAARVDEMFVRLLEVMHCGPVQDRNFLLKRNSSRLRDDCKQQINSLFQGDIRRAAVAAVDSAYASLERRHEVMHTIWTLSGRDGMTTVSEMVAAAESADPESALQSLSTRDIDTTAWRTVHPKSGAPARQQSPASKTSAGTSKAPTESCTR